MRAVDFAHPNRLACGPYVAHFLLETRGMASWPKEPKNVVVALLHPTFASTLVRMLEEHGLRARMRNFKSFLAGLEWLNKELGAGRPVALFVGPHWIVVTKRAPPKYEAYDSRVGKRSSAPNVSLGNTTLSEDEIFAEWKKGLFGGFYPYWAVEID